DRDLTADDGRVLQHLPGGLFEMVDPRREQGFDRGRQRDRIDPAGESVCAALAFEITALDQRVDQLFDEKRVALSALRDVARNQRQRGILAQQVVQQIVYLRPIERRQADLPVVGAL